MPARFSGRQIWTPCCARVALWPFAPSRCALGPAPSPCCPSKGSGRVWAGRRQHETAAKWRTTESLQSYAIYCRLPPAYRLRLPPALTAAQRLPPALGIRSSVVPCCPCRKSSGCCPSRECVQSSSAAGIRAAGSVSGGYCVCGCLAVGLFTPAPQQLYITAGPDRASSVCTTIANCTTVSTMFLLKKYVPYSNTVESVCVGVNCGDCVGVKIADVNAWVTPCTCSFGFYMGRSIPRCWYPYLSPIRLLFPRH